MELSTKQSLIASVKPFVGFFHVLKLHFLIERMEINNLRKIKSHRDSLFRKAPTWLKRLMISKWRTSVTLNRISRTDAQASDGRSIADHGNR
jgi:hypothetical protein